MNQQHLDLANVIREKFKGQQHRPVSEELAIQLTEGIDSDAVVGLFDAGCVISLTLIARGHDPSKIYVIEKSPEKCYTEFSNSLSKRLGFSVIEPPMGNLNRIDMKFDVIIGNPPYQNGNHNSTTNSLWKEFLDWSVKMSDRVYLVLPDIALAPPTLSKYKHNITQVNLDIKKHFPGVGSGFCSLLIEKNHGDSLKIITSDDEIVVPIGSLNCVPNNFNRELLDEMNDYLTGDREWNLTYEYESRKKIFTDGGKYEVLHTSSNGIRRTDVHHPNNDLIRVSVDVSGHPRFHFVHNMGLTQSHYWTVFETIEEARDYVDWGNSEETQSFLKKVKWGGMNSSLIIKNLR